VNFTHNIYAYSLQAYASLPCCTNVWAFTYTSNMAASALVQRITSQSSQRIKLQLATFYNATCRSFSMNKFRRYIKHMAKFCQLSHAEARNKHYTQRVSKNVTSLIGGAEIARPDIARPDNPAPCPPRWFRLPSVLRLDVEENDWTVRESVPTSTTAGAAIRTDVCVGGLWGGVSGRIFPR